MSLSFGNVKDFLHQKLVNLSEFTDLTFETESSVREVSGSAFRIRERFRETAYRTAADEVRPIQGILEVSVLLKTAADAEEGERLLRSVLCVFNDRRILREGSFDVLTGDIGWSSPVREGVWMVLSVQIPFSAWEQNA